MAAVAGRRHGLGRPDAGGQTTALLEGDADDAIGAGISVEPEGGSEQPTEVVALFDFEAA